MDIKTAQRIMEETAADRRNRLLRLYEEGLAVKDLAKVEGVTTKRIYQMLQLARKVKL